MSCSNKEQNMATGNDRVLVRNSAARNRAAKARVFLCALALGLGVSLAWTPTVPDTILLPDSLGPLRPGYHLAFGSSTNNIYVASESSDIIVVDGNTFRRIKRIYTGTPVGSVLLVNQHNKLYCTYPSQGRIGVIDCVTNSIIGSIPVSTRPKLLCYSGVSDKVYCGDSVNRRVSVIDCAADTVRKVILTGSSPADMVYDPATNKLYAATRNGLLTISCVNDSIVASLDSIRWARGLCLNKRRQKLYVVGRREQDGPDSIYVVSPQSDSVMAAMHFGWGIVPRLACNEATDRLYALTLNDGEFTREYDCLGDTYIRSAYTPGYEGEAIACDTVHNRLFHRSEYCLLILDCATFGVVAEIGMPEYDTRSDLLVLDPGRYRAMCTGWRVSEGWGALLAFDYKGNTVYTRGVAPLCGWANRMCHNPATSRLYCHLGGGVTAVVDEQTNRMVKWVQGVGSGLVYSRTSNKLYYPIAYGPSYEYQGLGVVDGTTDSLVKVIGLGDYHWQPFPCWCPVGNRVYCFASKGARLFMAAVDCSTDSVVWERDIYGHGRWFEYLDNGLMLCNSSTSLSLIDPRTDSVLVDSSLAAGGIYAVAHTGDGEKVYLARYGRLEVRSSSSLSLLKTVEWSYFDPSCRGTLLAYSDSTLKLYWFAGDSVLAIDATVDTAVARMSVTCDDACLDHTGRYLFCTSRYDSCLRVYDTRSDSLLAVYPQLPFPPLRVMSNPDLGCIYLACQDVVLVYPDAPPGVEQTPTGEVRATRSGPTVVRGVLVLGAVDSRQNTEYRAGLMDISGRKVMDLRPGANDVSHLGVGVYFVRSQPSAVAKVVIVK
jgi:hypothetical protein